MSRQRNEKVAAWQGAQGEFSLERVAPHVLVVRLTGVMDRSAAPVIERALNHAFASDDGLHVFWDLAELVNYHSDVRVSCTRVLLKHRSRFVALHAYSRARIVSMAVAVANLALGGIAEVHNSHSHFDAALNDAIAAQRASS